MSLLCRIFGHDWKYDVEFIGYNTPHGYFHPRGEVAFGPSSPGMMVSTVEHCRRCRLHYPPVEEPCLHRRGCRVTPSGDVVPLTPGRVEEWKRACPAPSTVGRADSVGPASDPQGAADLGGAPREEP